MTDIAPGLLPEGLHDRLPPEAESAATLLRAVMDATAAHGYERVQPPLAEFEANLVGRLKSTRQQDLLRFVDPVSQRTLALRPDMTAQVGRIATTRMAGTARPLRLAYGGAVLKVRGTQLRPEREMLQTGVELIGSDTVAAVAEVLQVALDALEAAGVTGVSVDLTLPNLVEALAAGPMPLAADKVPELQACLDGKDAAGLTAVGADAYQPLIAAAGPVDQALKRLRTLDAGDVIEERLDAVSILADGLRNRVGVTLDPTERHGFEYQSWIGFSLFGEGIPGEIGRGGSYTIVHADGREEKAVGFSIYLDPLVSAGLGRSARRRVFLPLGTDESVATGLRAQGWATVAAISQGCNGTKLGCTHQWNGLEAAPL